MGAFSVEVTLRNWQNRFILEGGRAQDVVCEAMVDTGASELCLPAEIVERLNLVEVGRMRSSDCGWWTALLSPCGHG